jgi:hypothetical protein
MNQITKQEWIKNFNSIHTFTHEELKILRQAKEIQSDPQIYWLLKRCFEHCN